MTKMIERMAQALCGDDNPENILTIHRTRASAAFEAIREPTPEMLEAAQNWKGQQSYTDIWKAMVDAARCPQENASE
jgi:hypothetical protein